MLRNSEQVVDKQGSGASAHTSDDSGEHFGRGGDDLDDFVCAVCADGGSAQDNPLLICDSCDSGYHQTCHGLSEVPPGDWFCVRCSGRVVLGFAGAGASGKTVLAETLSVYLNALLPCYATCAVLGIDAYHKTNARLEEEGLQHLKGRPQTFDLDAFEEALRQVHRRDQDILLPVYDRKLHEPRAGAVSITRSCQVVLVEGLFLNGSVDVRAMFDAVCFLDVDKDVSRERLLARQVAGGKTHEQAAAQYARVDGPNFDLVRQQSVLATHALAVDDHGVCGPSDAPTIPDDLLPLLTAARGVVFVHPLVGKERQPHAGGDGGAALQHAELWPLENDDHLAEVLQAGAAALVPSLDAPPAPPCIARRACPACDALLYAARRTVTSKQLSARLAQLGLGDVVQVNV